MTRWERRPNDRCSAPRRAARWRTAFQLACRPWARRTRRERTSAAPLQALTRRVPRWSRERAPWTAACACLTSGCVWPCCVTCCEACAADWETWSAAELRGALDQLGGGRLRQTCVLHAASDCRTASCVCFWKRWNQKGARRGADEEECLVEDARTRSIVGGAGGGVCAPRRWRGEGCCRCCSCTPTRPGSAALQLADAPRRELRAAHAESMTTIARTTASLERGSSSSQVECAKSRMNE
jgi:hypothetical protein